MQMSRAEYSILSFLCSYSPYVFVMWTYPVPLNDIITFYVS